MRLPPRTIALGISVAVSKSERLFSGLALPTMQSKMTSLRIVILLYLFV
jgi:hypothetical protein